jgi:GAF domain-containing protein
VRSSLSLPLSADGDVLGALNLYATVPSAFGDEEHRPPRCSPLRPPPR